MSTVYIDIDNVVWDANAWFRDSMRTLWDVEVSESDMTTWDYMAENAPAGHTWREPVEHALDPERVMQREFLPGFVEAVETLYLDCGHEIHFISHNHVPSSLKNPVDTWLSSAVHVPYQLTIYGARNDKVYTMLLDPEACAIIEDKPSTLLRAVKMGYIALARILPYNEEVVHTVEDIHGFVHWKEVPYILENALVERYADVIHGNGS